MADEIVAHVLSVAERALSRHLLKQSGRFWAAKQPFCGFAARSNGRGEPGRPADSLDLGNYRESSLSEMDRSYP